MSTGMLRAGSSRRSKTKSPYARPVRSTRSMPATDQARGPALATDQARATDPTLPTDQATTSSVQNIPQVPSSVPNACGMYSSPPAQMSTMPALEPQHSQPQGTSMSTVTSPLVAQHDSIWIVGSSLIKRAEQYASMSTEFGTDLSLPNVSVLWKGVSGLSFDSVADIICDLRSKYPHPRFLVIHAGGNDIGKDDNPLSRQQKFIKKVMVNLSTDMPSTCIVWSHILPRLYWRHAISNMAAETSRLRINSSVATLVLKIGGASIKYVDIKPNQSNLFLNDGVHLSPSGNHEFVSTMQSALRQFIEGKSLCYPKI
eukprot:XP_011412638.1 PREDICTED: uncharacterized protein LOC105317604 isoform X2 [Crassostrea gigas]